MSEIGLLAPALLGKGWTVMNLQTREPHAIKLFYSYSHADEHLLKKLQKQLSMLKRQGLLEDWHDRRLSAGIEWKGQIDEHLNSARIILLLVSDDFLASDYCYDIEMTRALERHKVGDARVIPVILRSVDWHQAPFGKLQALPKNGKPVESWANLDNAFTDVALGIRNVVEELSAPKVAAAQIEGPKVENPFEEITIIIDMNLADFDSRIQKWLRHGLAEFLEISPDDIQIVSREEGSVKVTLRLPKTSAEQLREALDNQNSELLKLIASGGLVLLGVATRSVTRKSIAPTMRSDRPVILVVEDNQAEVKLMMLGLSESTIDHTAFVTKDGQEAMDFLLNRAPFGNAPRPDLILLDTNIPRKDGFEVLNEMRSNDQLVAIPVVMFTTSQSAKDVRFAYSHHANAYMVKPCDAGEHLEMMEAIIDYWFGLVTLPGRTPRLTRRLPFVTSHSLESRRLFELLLVENSAVGVEIVNTAFAERGAVANLHIARDGEEALNFLRRSAQFADAPRPDLVLLDTIFPGRDAFEVLKVVKRDDRLREIPVVIVTNSIDDRDVIHAYQNHVNAYMVKPRSHDNLVKMLKLLREYWFKFVTLPSDE